MKNTAWLRLSFIGIASLVSLSHHRLLSVERDSSRLPDDEGLLLRSTLATGDSDEDSNNGAEQSTATKPEASLAAESEAKPEIAATAAELVTDTTISSPDQQPSDRILALLYPHGLMGGYRNQVIRFIGLCHYANQNNYTHLYLPSLLWTTQIIINSDHDETKENGNRTEADTTTTTAVHNKPIPMDWIFDIAHWNRVARDSNGSIPFIVDGPIPNADCWWSAETWWSHFNNHHHNTSDWGPLAEASFRRGGLPNITSAMHSMVTQTSIAGFHPRKTDLLPPLAHCQQPAVYGGGGGGAGRLWNEAIALRTSPRNRATSDALDRTVLRALQPLPRWQSLGRTCLPTRASTTPSTTNIQTHNPPTSGYVAVHARVEVEMLRHTCGRTMEQNLTNIFRQVHALVTTLGDGNQTKPSHNSATTTKPLSQVLVALSRENMRYQGKDRWQDIADYNWNALNRYTADGFVADDSPIHNNHTSPQRHRLLVSECGERLLERYYANNPTVPDHGSLLQAVINFDLAVQADVFVGVRGSSYSTDVFTTRYHLGRGAQNFRYTQGAAVEAVENGGLPPPHGNCKRATKR